MFFFLISFSFFSFYQTSNFSTPNHCPRVVTSASYVTVDVEEWKYQILKSLFMFCKVLRSKSKILTNIFISTTNSRFSESLSVKFSI